MGMLLTILLLALPPAAAPPLPGATGPQGPLLAWLMRSGKMARKVDQGHIQRVLRRGEAVHLDGGTRSAAALFGALLLDPSFWQLAHTPAHDNIRYDLASALVAEGAFGRARSILLEMIRRTPPSAFRAPAFRKLTDLTLTSRQYEQSLTALAQLPDDLARDELDEIAYLKGKALVSMGFGSEARKALATVSRRSRFHAPALYLLGVLALEEGDLDTATSRFCDIVRQPGSESATAPHGRYTFFVTSRTLEVIDHAWLALARIRHDAGAWRRAVKTYAMIEPGSDAGWQARYEVAWSLFRAQRHTRARSMLEELLARRPFMTDWPQARLLLGYTLLADCLFEPARQVFDGLTALLGPGAGVSAPVDLTAPVQAAVPGTRAERRAGQMDRRIREAARRVLWLRQMLHRLGSGMPQKPVATPGAELAADLRADLSQARRLERTIAELDARLPPDDTARHAELDKLAATVREAGSGARAALDRLQAGLLTRPPREVASLVRDADLPRAYLDAEQQALATLGRKLVDLGVRSRRLAGQAAEARRRRAARKVAGWVRATHIGQIDTVLGKKQALELEVQNLAQGRYPLSLFRELAEAGLVDESTEYWPYDGEDWPDEVQ